MWMLATNAISQAFSPDSQQQLHISRLANQSDSDLPPRADWQNILAPLRTDFQRQLASPYSFQPEGFSCWGTIWLRTCYDEGSDEAHQKLLDELNWDTALEVEENILDDAALYDYGDDWHRVFEVSPERLGFAETPDDLEGMTTPEQHETSLLEAQRAFNIAIDSFTDKEALKFATAQLHSQAVSNYLFVADKVALDTGKVLLVFYDDCGRTVRQARVRPEYGEQIAGAWVEMFIWEIDEFLEADIGPDYLAGGACGPPYAAYTNNNSELAMTCTSLSANRTSGE